MIQATAFHAGMRVGHSDVYDASDSCPVCHSRQPRQAVFNIQQDPAINMLCLSLLRRILLLAPDKNRAVKSIL